MLLHRPSKQVFLLPPLFVLKYVHTTSFRQTAEKQLRRPSKTVQIAYHFATGPTIGTEMTRSHLSFVPTVDLPRVLGSFPIYSQA